MAKELGTDLGALVGNEAVVGRIEPQRYVGDGVGLPTLEDILAELRKPGRDPREAFEAPQFRDDVQTLDDLREGMQLQGTVTNVVAFGAFVDIGVHQDGLVHVSELADRFVQDPNAVVKVGDRVTVRVLSVDLARRRIALSMKQPSNALSAAGAGAEKEAGDRPAKPRDRNPPPAAPQPGFAPNGMRITRR
jgi:protein Tex